MRVILLTHGGADRVIEHLAALPDVEIGGVFIETQITPKRGMGEKLKRSLKYDGLLGTATKLLPFGNGTGKREAAELPDRTKAAATDLGIVVNEVEDFHSDTSMALMKTYSAELGVLYGTNIIKESVFSIPKRGSINLHQGLAPFYRGGPPVFWELFNGEKEIGLTVHFVAAAVDTGDIILQKKVPLEFDAAFGQDFQGFIDAYRDGLREESAKLLANAVAAIASDNFQRAQQDTKLGRRYRLPTKKEKDELRRRLKLRGRNE